MNKDEYNLGKAKIIESFGKPEYDLGDPVNESAQRLRVLLNEYRLSLAQGRSNKRALEREEKQSRLTAAELASSPAIKARYKEQSIKIDSIELTAVDLAPFTDLEQDIIKHHLEDLSLSNKALAAKVSTKDVSVKVQAVTALLHTAAYRLLEARAFDRLIPTEARMAWLRALRGDDSKIILRTLEDQGILKTETLNLNLNKPIDDPAAIRMLKELGDRLMVNPEDQGL